MILKSQCFVPGVSDFACSSTSTSRKVFRTLDRLNMLHLLGRHLLGRHHYDSTMFLESLTRKEVHSYVKRWQDLVRICKEMLPQSQCLTFSQVSGYFRLLQASSGYFRSIFQDLSTSFLLCRDLVFTHVLLHFLLKCAFPRLLSRRLLHGPSS